MSLTQKYSYTFKMLQKPSSQTLTSSFRTIGRDVKHAFGQKLNRNYNDLDYQIQKKNTFTKSLQNSQKRKTSQKINTKKDSRSPQYATFKVPDNRSPSSKQYRTNGINPQNYQKNKLQDSSPTFAETRNSFYPEKGSMNRSASSEIFKIRKTIEMNNFGLSPFEAETTIMGKIQKRQSHHLDFSKMPNRPQNINKVWYSKNKAISLLDVEKNQQIKKIHPFKSDRPHNSFLPAPVLDKVYDCESPIKLVKSRSDIKIRKMEHVNKRPQLSQKISTQLSYNKDRSLLNNKKPLMLVSQSPRKLQISREVISPRQGCYR